MVVGTAVGTVIDNAVDTAVDTSVHTAVDTAVVLPALRRMGLIDADEIPQITPLTGGVSSLIVRVDTRRGPVCLKQALPALKVATEWLAPQERSHAEVAWMRVVSARWPQAVPALLGEDAASYSFAMRWLPPHAYPVWKALLRDGGSAGDVGAGAGHARQQRNDLGGIADMADIADIDDVTHISNAPKVAAQVATLVAAIHAGTAGDAALAARFATDRNFHELRLDPYFGAAARAHPDCAAVLQRLITDTAARKLALVHGDISPKNILVGRDGPVILDAECAWYGDPAFDAAFCLCHLLAKCLWRPAHRAHYLAAWDAFCAAYLDGVHWETRDAIEARIALLLAAILLARVDGKSPLEYLGDTGREAQRQFARRWLLAPDRSLAAMRADWQAMLA